MLAINGQSGEFVIDLNQSHNQIYEFAIVSQKSNGRFIPMGIDINTNPSAIQVEWKQNYKIVFIVDLEQIKQTETVYLKNYAKERLAIRFLPNVEESSPKTYTFKVGKTQVDGKKLSLSIISKQNKKSWPWEIEYFSPTLSCELPPPSVARKGLLASSTQLAHGVTTTGGGRVSTSVHSRRSNGIIVMSYVPIPKV